MERASVFFKGKWSGPAWVALVALLLTSVGLSAAPADFETARLLEKIRNLHVAPRWLGSSDRLWFREETRDGGWHYWIFDARTASRSSAFDHDALARALSLATGDRFAADRLPLDSLNPEADGLTVSLAGRRFRCSGEPLACEAAGAAGPMVNGIPDPAGTRVVFLRDHDLWLLDVASGEEQRLSSDGEAGFSYGQLAIDFSRVARRRAGKDAPLASVHWSPDGRYLLTGRRDLRSIPRRPYVVEHLPPDQPFTVGHLDRTVFPADRVQVATEVAVFDTQTGVKRVIDIDPALLQDYADLYLSFGVVWWSVEKGTLVLVTATSGGERYGLIEISLKSGTTRELIAEEQAHWYGFNAHDYHFPAFHYSADGSEFLWYSQREGSGQLYLYDAVTGDLKRRLSSGAGVVFDLLRVDEERREVYYTAGGVEEGRNPYYAHLYRVSMDGGEPVLLTPEDAMHDFARSVLPTAGFAAPASSLSPSGNYFVDSFSTTDAPPTLVVRNRDGELVSELLRADIEALLATGWTPPERFVVPAADGVTPLHGVLFKPTTFDERKRYPVIDQMYPGPQRTSAPKSFKDNFVPSTAFNAQATAEAGFIVVSVDGRGTTGRDAAFRYAFAGQEDVFGAVDHRAALEQLARQRPYLDLSRVGVTGLSYGGYGSLRAALLFPAFFDVVVSHVGPHEYESSSFSGVVNERFFGPPGDPDGVRERVSNLPLLDGLQAELMLVYGEIDENVPLRAAMQIFESLMQADKDFTSYVVPNADHLGAGSHPFIVKRQRRFFVEHLAAGR
ncbi:MAG: S9 family peptidase [Pseudohaliea sp.]